MLQSLGYNDTAQIETKKGAYQLASTLSTDRHSNRYYNLGRSFPTASSDRTIYVEVPQSGAFY